jgi:hypothetical protein
MGGVKFENSQCQIWEHDMNLAKIGQFSKTGVYKKFKFLDTYILVNLPMYALTHIKLIFGFWGLWVQ